MEANYGRIIMNTQIQAEYDTGMPIEQICSKWHMSYEELAVILLAVTMQ